MSNDIIPSIGTLPVEIFHRIFDNLDAQTLLFSVRPVCRLFRAVVNTYDRYSFDFKSISKSNFHLLCRLINPQKVISLTLSDNEHIPDQVSLFISSVRLRQLTRLHSITFLGIEEFQLDIILKSINLTSLTSFSLNIQKYDNRRKKTTLNLLSSILTQSTLRKLELKINYERISNISWPLNCHIEYLIIDEDITFDIMYKILFNSPQLHTLTLKQSLSNMNNITIPSSFPQLTSLTVEKLDVKIDKLESFLSMTPSLIYLKVIGEGCIMNGKRWEQFIQINLPHLNKFQFFVNDIKPDVQTREDLELSIESFRSPFWIEYKKWFIAGELNKNHPYTIQVYSIPICKAILEYNLDLEKVFLSTLAMSSHNDPAIMKNINEIILPLRKTSYLEKEGLTKNNPLFPKITKLSIDVNRETPLESSKLLRSLIDISQLVEVKLESFYFNKNNKNLLLDMITAITQSYNLTSLTIHSRYCQFELYPFLNAVCSIIPRQIKHLQIPINRLDQIEIILERCQYLSIVRFEITRLKFSNEVRQWFAENTIDSTIRRHNGCDIVWIGKKTKQMEINHKRMKLTDNRFDT